MKKIISGLVLLFCASFMFAEKIVNVKVGESVVVSNKPSLSDIEYFTVTEVKMDGDNIFVEFALKERGNNILYLKYHFEKDEYTPFYVIVPSGQQISFSDFKYAKVRLNTKNEIMFVFNN